MRLDLTAFAGDEPVTDPLGTIVSAFREGAALVDAALQALSPVTTDLEALRASILRRGPDGRIDTDKLGDAVGSIRLHLESATVSGDNLLIDDLRTRGGTFLVFGLSRQASGAVTTQAIPIERESVVLMGATPDGPRVFDHLAAAAMALRDGIADSGDNLLVSRLAAMTSQVAAAASRLSIVKARVGLQSSFVRAVADSGIPDPTRQFGGDLDQSGIRDLALATKRLLSRKAFDIGSDNRQVLQTLFARHTAETAGD